MEYEWDDAKYAANLHKHGVSFEMVENFDWTTAFVVADERFEYGEERRFAIGMIGSRIHVLVFTIRKDRIRVISLRKAKLKERKLYHEQNR
ncbi:MAG: BrnT family toxin [Alphaproteobacteria bacterium]|nr:MAG: BrnT family toxin [Alphaproteobacteria bacterium]